MTLLRIALAGLLLVTACHRTPPALIDLSCDMIQFDATRDAHRLELRRGVGADSSLRSAGSGRLVFRYFAYADSAWLDRVRTTLTPAAGGSRFLGGNDSSLVSVVAPAGTYRARVTCAGCSRADTSLRVDVGRVDTIDAYLTRFPTNCELAAKR